MDSHTHPAHAKGGGSLMETWESPGLGTQAALQEPGWAVHGSSPSARQSPKSQCPHGAWQKKRAACSFAPSSEVTSLLPMHPLSQVVTRLEP